jgi:hypothetical protein
VVSLFLVVKQAHHETNMVSLFGHCVKEAMLLLMFTRLLSHMFVCGVHPDYELYPDWFICSFSDHSMLLVQMESYTAMIPAAIAAFQGLNFVRIFCP